MRYQARNQENHGVIHKPRGHGKGKVCQKFSLKFHTTYDPKALLIYKFVGCVSVYV